MKYIKTMRKGLFAFCMLLFLLPASDLSAQKMGYTNYLALVSQMPEVSLADTVVMQLRDSLLQEGETRANALQDLYEKYVVDAQAGTLTPVQAQEREAKIQKGQEDLQKYEQEITKWLGLKREELYNPALTKLEKAIQEVGVENGFQFIFDVSSLNVIVYAEEQVDVTSLVKAKLGLK